MNKQEIEKAIADLQEYIGGGEYNGSNPPIYLDTAMVAIEALQQLLTNGWILVDSRLPQENEDELALCKTVNILMKNGEATSGWCNRYLKKWFVLLDTSDMPVQCEYNDIIAWQPLPGATA